MLRSDVGARFVAVLLGVVLGAGAQTAVASFLESGTAESTFSSDTLAPPTNPAVSSAGCSLGKPRAQVTWTATPSEWADGYEIGRSLLSGGPYTYVATVSGQSTTSFVDSDLTALTTYYYVVRATKAGWRSTPTAQVFLATPPC